MSNLIAIGVGGTGAKLVEALIHLSASGHSPDTIYPILIDQDLHNGNVQRTKKVIQQYKILNELINSFGSQGIFNSELRLICLIIRS